MKEMTLQRQGYYENGHYFINDAASIPNRRTRVTVIFHNVEDAHEKKAAAIKDILADALSAERELTGVDWDEMAKLRLQTNAGLSRRLDI